MALGGLNASLGKFGQRCFLLCGVLGRICEFAIFRQDFDSARKPHVNKCDVAGATESCVLVLEYNMSFLVVVVLFL